MARAARLELQQKLARLKQLRDEQERKISEGAGRGVGETQQLANPKPREGYTTPPTNIAAGTPPAPSPSPPANEAREKEAAGEPAAANDEDSRVNLATASAGLDGKNDSAPPSPVYPDDYTLHSSEDAQHWTVRKDRLGTTRYEESDGRPQPVPHDHISVESTPASHDTVADTLFDTSIDDDLFETSSYIISVFLSVR